MWPIIRVVLPVVVEFIIDEINMLKLHNYFLFYSYPLNFKEV